MDLHYRKPSAPGHHRKSQIQIQRVSVINPQNYDELIKFYIDQSWEYRLKFWKWIAENHPRDYDKLAAKSKEKDSAVLRSIKWNRTSGNPSAV